MKEISFLSSEFRNMKKYDENMKKHEGIWRNMKKFFQVLGPRGKLGIFPGPRVLEEARNFSKSQEYERM